MLTLRPVTLSQAKAFVSEHHRHHVPSVGWKFGVSVWSDGEMVGVAMAGRPVARGLDDGETLEVTRTCTLGARNANSMLYGAICRAAKALGYKRVVTYTLHSEPGSSIAAAGFSRMATVKGRKWSCPSRPRADKHPTCDKIRWQRTL